MQNQFSLKEARKAKESIIQRRPIQVGNNTAQHVQTYQSAPVAQTQQVQPVQQVQHAQATPQVQQVQQVQQAQQAQPSIQQIQNLQNMQNMAQQTQNISAEAICPGPVSPIRPCPPFQFIDVLKVLKVFQECRIVETNQVVDAPIVPVGAVDVVCLGSEVIGTPSCVTNFDGTVTITFSFATAFQFVNFQGFPVGNVQVIETLNETRTVRLSRAGEPGLSCEADIFLDCIECFVSSRGPLGQILEVTCCVGKQILVKLVALVQLLVPTFGYAPVPPECEQVAGLCPDFTPTWPPYPPQSPDFPFPRGTSGTLGTTGTTRFRGNCSCSNN